MLQWDIVIKPFQWVVLDPYVTLLHHSNVQIFPIICEDDLFPSNVPVDTPSDLGNSTSGVSPVITNLGAWIPCSSVSLWVIPQYWFVTDGTDTESF